MSNFSYSSILPRMIFRKLLLAILFTASSLYAAAQKTKPKPTAQNIYGDDQYGIIKDLDLGKLWRSDSLFVMEHNYNDEQQLIFTNPHMVVFPEPIGFIDTSFQRFDIHIMAAMKSDSDPYKYMVVGKTRLKGIVNSFIGTIIIKKAMLLKQQEFPAIQRGVVFADYIFYEDNKKPNTGVLAGKLQTNWYFDKDKKLTYDNLDVEADRYCNNQYTGTWTAYKNAKRPKKCNWGDYRIPASGPLDNGVSEFSVNGRYIKNGWQNYVDAHWSTDATTKELAADKENETWWKQ